MCIDIIRDDKLGMGGSALVAWFLFGIMKDAGLQF